MATIDRLEIQIEAQASNASKQLDILVSKLGKLSTSLAGAGLGKNTSLNNLNKNLSQYSTNANVATKSTKSLALSIGKLYGSAFLAIRGIKALGKAIESSMDFLETVNYFEVAMRQIGDSASAGWEEAGYNSAEAYAESFSARAKQLTEKMTGYAIDTEGNATNTGQKSLGLDPSKVLQNQAVFAQMSNSIGVAEESALNFSKALTMLGADWASLRNITFDQAWEKFASALAGQSRAVRSLGIDITMATLQEVAYANGVKTAVSEMNQATKAQLRLLAILKQSEVAFGDLANTISSPSNQLRLLQQNFANLARTIGNLFLPIVSKILPIVNGIVIALQRLFQWIGGLLGIKFDTINSSMGGMSNSMSDLVGGTDDYENSLEDANKAAKKLKSTVLGIDELNINAPDEGGKDKDKPLGGGGIPELDTAISDALAEYEKVWNDAFDRMENKAQEFADNIGKFFKKIWDVAEPTREALSRLWNEGLKELSQFSADTLKDFYNNFLVPVGKWLLGNDAGLPRLFNVLNKMLTDIDWGKLRNSLYDLYTSMSNLAIFAFDSLFDFVEYFLAPLGTWVMSSALPQLADILKGFIDDVNWEKINSALERFWKALLPFAQSVGQGMINFFRDLAKIGASFINIVVPGGINALASALNMMNPATIERIGYALGALLTAYLGFRALKGINTIIDKAWKAIYGKEFIDGIKKTATGIGGLATKFKTFAKAVPLATDALMGNEISAKELATTYPKTGKKVSDLALSFGNLKTMIADKGFFGGVNQGIEQLRNNLTGMQKGVIGTVAVFAEFSIIKDNVYGMVSGTENLVAGFSKIAIAAGVAGTALYVAFGPAGIVIAAITGVVGAIVGIDKAMDEIKENSAMEAVGNSLKNPGGTPLSEITANYQAAIEEIGNSFDSINEKSQELETTKSNVDKTVKSIDLIAFAMDNGSTIVGEKIPQLTEMFGQLVTDSKTLFDQEYDIIMTALAGSLGDAAEQAGISIPEFIGHLDGLKTNYDLTLEEIKTSNAQLKENLDKGIITQDEYTDSFIKNIQKLSEISGKTDEYTESIDSVNTAISGIDFGKFITDENVLDVAKISEEFGKLSSTSEDAKEKINASSETVTSSLNDLKTRLKSFGDTEGVSQIGEVLLLQADGVNLATGEVDKSFVEYGNKVQTALLKNIPNVIDTALADYEKQGWLYKLTTSETEHTQAALDEYQTNVLDKATSELETMYSDFGIEGAGWASEAGKNIIDGLFDSEYHFSDMGSGGYYYTLKDNYQSIVTGALGAAQTEIEKETARFGKDTVDGYGNGILDNSKVSTDAINTWMSDNVTAIHDSSMNFGSPSKTTKQYGLWTVEGYNDEILNGIQSTADVLTLWMDSVKSYFTADTWTTIFSGINTAFSTKWSEFTTKWTESLTSWWEAGVKPWFTVEKWMIEANGMKLGITTKWTEFTVLWKTNITMWWTSSVQPWFSVEKWTILGNNMKTGMFNGFKGITEQINDILNKIIKAFESAINNINSSMNDMVKNYNANASKMGVSELSKFSNVTINRVPAYAAGGLPEDGLFYANHSELVGQFNNGRTAVANNDMITAGIEEAAYRGFARANAENNQEAGLLRELIEAVREGKVIEIDGREITSAINSRNARNGWQFST